jgi:hypothetical protein
MLYGGVLSLPQEQREMMMLYGGVLSLPQEQGKMMDEKTDRANENKHYKDTTLGTQDRTTTTTQHRKLNTNEAHESLIADVEHYNIDL